jgi:hypothetical protein
MTDPARSETIRQHARQLAEGLACNLGDEERDEYLQEAQRLVPNFLEGCKDGLEASLITSAIAKLIATLQTMPLTTAVEEMERAICIYGITAGVLAGVYGPQAVTVDTAEMEPLIGAYL